MKTLGALTISRRDFRKASDVFGKGRHEISKTSGFFPKNIGRFRENISIFPKKFHETRQNLYRIKTTCPFLFASQKNNVSKTALLLTLCKAINGN
jgi:hypothetical protein